MVQKIDRWLGLGLRLFAVVLMLSSTNCLVGVGLGGADVLASDRPVISDRERRQQYPPKIIATKQVTGRLKSLIWGDYFYAEIARMKRSGSIIFLIDRDEDCLLRKFPGQKITIRYTEMDRYLPEAGGYHRVNIIRQIEGIDVKQWQKSRSQSQLKQCERDRPTSTKNYSR